jgi:hypothetical protein
MVKIISIPPQRVFVRERLCLLCDTDPLTRLEECPKTLLATVNPAIAVTEKDVVMAIDKRPSVGAVKKMWVEVGTKR